MPAGLPEDVVWEVLERLGSVTAAAREIGVSQPTLSLWLGRQGRRARWLKIAARARKARSAAAKERLKARRAEANRLRDAGLSGSCAICGARRRDHDEARRADWRELRVSGRAGAPGGMLRACCAECETRLRDWIGL